MNTSIVDDGCCKKIVIMPFSTHFGAAAQEEVVKDMVSGRKKHAPKNKCQQQMPLALWRRSLQICQLKDAA